MLRSRALKHWAGIMGLSAGALKIRADMQEVLANDPELTIADMKKWILRECDVPNRQYWMPHRVITGVIVRVYYVWVGPDPVPGYIIVLAIGCGRAEIHKWTDGKLEITPANVEAVPAAARPDITDSMQIMEYLSKFTSREQKKEASMTVNGVKVKGVGEK